MHHEAYRLHLKEEKLTYLKDFNILVSSMYLSFVRYYTMKRILLKYGSKHH